MQEAISYHTSTHIFAHIWLLAPSLPVIKASLPAVDTPDMEACSLSRLSSSSFPLPLSLHFLLAVLCLLLHPSLTLAVSHHFSTSYNWWTWHRGLLSLSVSRSVRLPPAFPSVSHHCSTFWNWFTWHVGLLCLWCGPFGLSSAVIMEDRGGLSVFSPFLPASVAMNSFALPFVYFFYPHNIEHSGVLFVSIRVCNQKKMYKNHFGFQIVCCEINTHSSQLLCILHVFDMWWMTQTFTCSHACKLRPILPHSCWEDGRMINYSNIPLSIVPPSTLVFPSFQKSRGSHSRVPSLSARL